MNPHPAKDVRCAIYTRKSSEEGLEQDFNSLDAQREACSAYIRSQASEGWNECGARYDDGGISGGTLTRPGLLRLLADIAAGTIDIVVVYKVDRLTRSLLDFAKLVEAFDRAGVSFVSVTQSFNTTTSMGRLTLNMLLSFAQFEREVTAERIRDKIAASKAKGMWMGGTPPLGYKPSGRTLAIDENQASLIHLIHSRYRELGTVRALADWLASEQILTPVRRTGTGKTFGGARFSRGQLYSILRNRVYVGEIVHGDNVYPGQHPPLLGRAEWDAVQVQLASHVQGTRTRRAERRSPLAGILFDSSGERLIAVHTAKGVSRYRYYVSEGRHHECSTHGMRLPARTIEQLVEERVAKVLGDPAALAQCLGITPGVETWQRLQDNGARLAAELPQQMRGGAMSLLERVEVGELVIAITLDAAALAEALDVSIPLDTPNPTIDVPATLRRSGRALRLVDQAGAEISATPQASLIRLIVQARRFWAALRAERITIAELAARNGVTSSYATRVLRVAFLAPAAVEVIIAGRQRADLSILNLLALCEERDWGCQSKVMA